MSIELVYLAGRCANGYERDRGRVIHAKHEHEHRALCGKRYGRLSAGWADALGATAPTCLACERKLATLRQTTQGGAP